MKVQRIAGTLLKRNHSFLLSSVSPSSSFSPLSTITRLHTTTQVRYQSNQTPSNMSSPPSSSSSNLANSSNSSNFNKLVPHSFCGFCGSQFPQVVSYPRECTSCFRKVYVNPIPVAVCVVPVDDGVLLVRRDINPMKGKLAFPGGFMGMKESWQQAAVRELFEETGVIIDPVEIEHFHTASAPDADVVLIFGLCKTKRKSKDLPPFSKNDEVSERLVLSSYQDLAFDLHSEVLKLYLSSRHRL